MAVARDRLFTFHCLLQFCDLFRSFFLPLFRLASLPTRFSIQNIVFASSSLSTPLGPYGRLFFVLFRHSSNRVAKWLSIAPIRATPKSELADLELSSSAAKAIQYIGPKVVTDDDPIANSKAFTGCSDAAREHRNDGERKQWRAGANIHEQLCTQKQFTLDTTLF